MGGAHCTEIDFALSFGAVIVKMIDLSKTESRDFFDIILYQTKSQQLHLLPFFVFRAKRPGSQV